MNSVPEPVSTVIPMRRLLLVLVPAMLLIPIAADMVSLVLPLIATQFTASTAEVAWVVTGFLLVCSIGIPVYGRIADRFSLRQLFTVALTVFAIGSLICALAPSLLTLVLGRIVMGAGGAAIPVLAIVAAARLLPSDKTAVGVGFIGAAAGVGTAAGPVVGGVLGQLLGWPALFWLMTLTAAALIPATRRVIIDDAPDDRRPFDLLGGLLLGLGAGLLLFGVTRAEAAGFGSVYSSGAMLAGSALAALFIWRTRAAAHPFVPPSLFTNRGYVAAVVVIFLAMVANLATLVLVPILVLDVNGLSPGQGSLVMIPGGVALAVLSPLAGRVGARGANEGTVTLAGLTAIALSMLLLSTVAVGASTVLAGLAVLVLGAGFAFVVTLATSTVSRVLPPEQVGIGVGIFQGAQFLGAGAGPALFGAVLSARQAGGQDAVNPLYTNVAPAYSDTFLALTLVVLLAMVAALRLRKARATHRSRISTRLDHDRHATARDDNRGRRLRGT
ncbi:DHA2 family metal-tetracycline-proton antiporter-like MFS transporter/DHA2 family florfenicol/chloramphenicol resistance protein-like MFS transporter [Haloactinopolyspora alba]|uniref:DHA2 family metal-tetracycline-proton antiporter-like MFS transporter/DHA2 family florfenicol/chloramphenicol resistance protein-like MFS transporter n=1 Tax=Haloactinopolyspora alba TaxID=648780 RepID=A0A2P8EF19_9ACTN|nr:MFS transporter [Haloactinopolyspora alba]PSL08079.1 DHA2 family metal-tetracycline-proton antiporter-like MFS transporter/DHA2 family florfenicol/chloramphenicol resistance protein-like MFS transporter [Haloactinopolyspora alba]